MRITGNSIISLFIVASMAVFVFTSFGYSPKARLLPVFIGSLLFIMAVIQFISQSFPSTRKFFPFLKQVNILINSSTEVESEESNSTQDQAEKDNSTDIKSQSWRVVMILLLYLIGFLILTYYTSYIIAVPVFLFLFFYFVGKEKLTKSLIIACMIGLLMYVLFNLILSARI